ncbi:hypothetical protein CHU98_g2912 [Xylaria longipes]|nr:hypothetical protein CHU98_g2912 [Xylaria longipes]
MTLISVSLKLATVGRALMRVPKHLKPTMQSVLSEHCQSFPPIGACIFDMDVLLINSEDIITLSMNQELENSPVNCGECGAKIELALASGTKTHIYELKTSKPKNQRLLSFFQADRGVLGDGPWVQKGRGKPAPYIYQAALQSINSILDSASSAEKPISPNECLVFEDSIARIDPGRDGLGRELFGYRIQIWPPSINPFRRMF